MLEIKIDRGLMYRGNLDVTLTVRRYEKREAGARC
jgi:hypothetical protein